MGHEQKGCEVAACGQRHYARGLCKRHYTQVKRHGRLSPESERGGVRFCTAPGCAADSKAVGRYHGVMLCRRHARQVRLYGRLTPERQHVFGMTGCRTPGCGLPHRAKGLCTAHYNAARWRAIRDARKNAPDPAPQTPPADVTPPVDVTPGMA